MTMQDVLKRTSSIGNIRGILLFEAKLFDEQIISIDALKDVDKYELGIQVNIRAAIAFFEYLDLIIVKNNKILLSNKGLELKNQQATQRNVFISQLLLHKMIDDNFVNIQNIHVLPETGKIYFDNNAFALVAAIFRNFLISVKCLTFDSERLVVNKSYEKELVFLISNKRKLITQEELLAQLERERNDGALAEQIVLKYEQERLPTLSSEIKQVSLIDVSAGYDILSFNDSSSLLYDRFVEVKCFRGNLHFYWSSNEKSVAELMGENYFLYLVDLEIYSRDPKNFQPTIIQNPSKSIDSENWIVEATNFFVTKIKNT